ncbi:YlxR family protein [Candidatus Peregrinibacteria bacterium]|nr:MAG: YlxR family protein [Candidatus Peregrinibacteria bacterium]
MKSIIRTCAGCKGKFDQSDLIRLIKSTQGGIAIQARGGRGLYLCKKQTCFKRLNQPKRLHYLFKTSAFPENLERDLMSLCIN